MAIALRGTNGGTQTVNTGGTLTVPVPAGTVAGDVLVILVSVVSSATVPATPAGLTLLDSGSTGPSYASYYRVCDGTEPASYAFTVTKRAAGISASYSGVDNTSPINAHGAPNKTATVSATATTITTTANGCQLIFVSTIGTANETFTNPTGFANQLVKTSTSNNTLVFCDEAQATAGATGTVTGTWSAANNNFTQLIALKPAASAGPQTINGALVADTPAAYGGNPTGANAVTITGAFDAGTVTAYGATLNPAGAAPIAGAYIAGSPTTYGALLAETMTNNAEGGTDGVAVTAGDPGSGNPWTIVDAIAANGAVARYSSAHPAHGNLGYKLATGATSTSCSLRWDRGVPMVTSYGRFYVLWDGATGSHRIAQFREKTVGINLGYIAFGGATKSLELVHGSEATTAWISSVALSPLTKYRVEWEVTVNGDGTSTMNVSIYAGDSTTPLDSSGPTTVNANSGTPTAMQMFSLGAVNPAANYPAAGVSLYVDEVVAFATAPVGPAATLSISGALASSTGTVFGATVQAAGAVTIAGAETTSPATAYGGTVTPAGAAILSASAANAPPAEFGATLTGTGTATIAGAEATYSMAAYGATLTGAGSVQLAGSLAPSAPQAVGGNVQAAGHDTIAAPLVAVTPVADGAALSGTGTSALTGSEAVAPATAYGGNVQSAGILQVSGAFVQAPVTADGATVTGAGAAQLDGAEASNTPSAYGATLAPGPVTIGGAEASSSATTYGATLTTGANIIEGAYVAAIPAAAGADLAGAGAAPLSGARAAATPQAFAGSLHGAGTATIAGGLAQDAPAAYGGTVTAGALHLQGAYVPAAPAVSGATLGTSTATIHGGAATSTPTVPGGQLAGAGAATVTGSAATATPQVWPGVFEFGGLPGDVTVTDRAVYDVKLSTVAHADVKLKLSAPDVTVTTRAATDVTLTDRPYDDVALTVNR